jgi:hypothetical protein
MKDSLFCWAKKMSHRWHTVAIDKVLCFFEYSDREARGIECSAWSDIIFGDQYHPLQEAFIDHQDLFNTMFYWQDKFEVRVFRRTWPGFNTDKGV